MSRAGICKHLPIPSSDIASRHGAFVVGICGMSDRTEIALEVVGASVANKTTAAGAVTGALGWLAQINWIGLSGVMIALVGLLANLYFQHRRDKREQAEREERCWREEREHQKRMAAFKDKREV